MKLQNPKSQLQNKSQLPISNLKTIWRLGFGNYFDVLGLKF
jgi:hypothetical protein